MKTLLTNIKTTLVNNATLAPYIKAVEICAPRSLPDIAVTLLPWLGIAPSGSAEAWKSNSKKEVIHQVEIYVVNMLQIVQTAIIGSDTDRGILDIGEDVKTAVRGSTFSDYLSRPTDLIGVDYTTVPYGDNVYLIVLTMRLQCARIFSV